MTIKDYIKEKLEEIISEEEQRLNSRIELNENTGDDNYDNNCEKRFIDKLKEFVFSI